MVSQLKANGHIGKRVIFVTHEFTGDIKNAPWMHMMADSILSIEEEATVFLVGWPKGSGAYENIVASILAKVYMASSANTATVADAIASVALEIRSKRRFFARFVLSTY